MKKFSLSFDDFDNHNLKDVVDVFKSKKYTMGRGVEKFEKKIASWLGVKNAIMVNSGSSANLLLVSSLLYRTNKKILKKGDEVLVPALSWPTTIWPLVQLGLKPIFTDIDVNSLAIDLNSAKKMLSKKTKAMFLIHVMGQSCDMKIYKEFCSKNNLILLEDCCESFGAFFNKQSVGSFGYGGTFSHYFSHHLSTIEGGTIITNDDHLADDIRSLRSHGWIRDRKDKKKFQSNNVNIDRRWLFVLPGYNVRPTEIQGVLGIRQIKRINEKLLKREQVVLKINKILSEANKIIEIIGKDFIDKKISKNSKKNQRKHSWMNIPILVKLKKINSKKVMDIFESCGIETRPIISGNIIKHPALRSIEYRSDRDLKNTNLIHQKGFLIGCHDKLTSNNFNQLKKAIKKLKNIYI